MIRFKNLTKSYEKGKGIYDFSFEVEAGEVFGLVGPALSGKTTALRMLMGYEEPSKGRCAINGKDCNKYGLSLHKIIGYLPEKVILPKNLTARQFLRYNAQMRGIRNLERLFGLARRLELEVDEKIGNMTTADVKKTGMVCAMLHNPQVLLLDEPFKDLDMGSRSQVIDLILEEKEEGKMILLTSESVSCVELTSDRVGLLDQGNMIYLGDIESLRENMHREFLVQFGSGRTALQFSREEFEIKSLKDRSVVVSLQGALLPLIQALARYHVTGIEQLPLPLKETFVHIYGGGRDEYTDSEAGL